MAPMALRLVRGHRCPGISDRPQTNRSARMTEPAPYQASDEGLHVPTDEPMFSESMYFSLYDEASGVGGMLRVANRVNQGYAEMTLNLPLPDGTIAFDYRRTPIIENVEFAAGGMKIAVTEPLSSLHLTYDDEAAFLRDPSLLASDTRRALRDEPRVRTEVNLMFNRLHPHLERITATGDMSDGSLPLARDHYEQFGILTGTIKVGEQNFQIKHGLSMRDHSWGPREWVAPVYWRQALPMMDDGTCVSASRIGLSETEAATGGLIVTPDGTTHSGGNAVIETEFEYTGAPTFEGGYTVDIETTDGTKFHADASVIAFIPLRHRAPGRTAVMRVGQTLSRFESAGRVGYGWTDFWRRLDDGDPWASA